VAIPAPSAQQRTSLYERHVAAGAKIVDFAGWEMPVQYPGGVRAEHMAVRERCGIFDVSHMGEIETVGPQAEALLQRLLSNDVSKIGIGGSQYSVLCDERGGVLDDLFTYRLEPDRYLTVTNASNHERDLGWFAKHSEDFDAQVHDRIEEYAMLAVQGPLAREIVQAVSDAPLPSRMTAATRRLSGANALVCATGYTGEDGVELLLEPDDAPALWDELCRRGAAPAGLAARDTLRLEACFHLYGNDLSIDRNPLDGPGIARHGNPVLGGGEVTSGTLSPCLNAGIGLAYVPAEHSALDTPMRIDVRGRVRDATVHAKPFVAKSA
jgi:aminomethyltransferase